MSSPVWRIEGRLPAGETEFVSHNAESEEAFAAMVERHAAFLYRVAYAVLRNAHDAEDAVQETFLKIFRTRAWMRMDDERAFLARSVWRSAVDRLSKSNVRAMEEGEEFVATGRSPEEQAAQTSEAQRLKQLIHSLPEELRQPLLLTALEGMTSRAAAEVMGIPEGTVRTRVMRAREELRKKFERRRTDAGLR